LCSALGELMRRFSNTKNFTKLVSVHKILQALVVSSGNMLKFVEHVTLGRIG